MIKKHMSKKAVRPPHRMLNEKAFDTQPLNRDMPEEARDTVVSETETASNNTANWSEAQDRGEDLAEMKDPFTQEPERETQIPSELAQDKQSGKIPNADENLSKMFDKERQSPPL